MSINTGSNFRVTTTLPLDAKSVVADNTARDAIVAGQRYDGLVTYVIATGLSWQLQGGITNSDWVAYGTGSSGTSVIQSVVFSTPGATTWAAPIDCDPVVWLGIWGAGGGGGSGVATGGAGGNGGGFRLIPYYITPGTTYDLSIGDGGPGATDGEITKFDLIAFTGGRAGANAGANAAAIAAKQLYSGVYQTLGGAGTAVSTPGAGESNSIASGGSVVIGGGGADGGGGGAGFGNGGNGGSDSGSGPSPTVGGIGAGGGGGFRSGAGAKGGPGQITVYYTTSSGGTTPATETQQTIADNQSAAASITGLTVDSAVYIYAKVDYSIYRFNGSTDERRETGYFTLEYLSNSSTWQIGDRRGSSDALNIGTSSLSVTTTAGVAQVKYKSDNMSSTVGKMRWKIVDRIGVET